MLLMIGMACAVAYRDGLGTDLQTSAAVRPRLDLAATKLESVDGRYRVRGELYNAGRVAASSTVLRLVFRKGDEVLAERLYPLIEGPIVPGGRLAFVRELEAPPEGTTEVVSAVE